LDLKYDQDITSNILLEINAENLKYTATEGKALIEAISIKPFESFTTAGTMSVFVQSLTSLPSSYTLSYNCSETIMPLSAKTFSLKGKEGKYFNSTVHSTTDLFAENNCTLDLKAKSTGKLLDTKFIAFETRETNYTKP
jgi:hypothetical protein